VKLLLLCTIFILSNVSFSREEIRVLTYHPGPPLIINKEKKIGFTYELVKFLNEQDQDRYTFVLTYLPRKRLDKEILRGGNIIVPWTTPQWFRDKKRKKYRWSNSLLKTGNTLISNIKTPIKKLDLNGKKLAGLRGGRWPFFEEEIKNGIIKKHEVNSYKSVIRMVERGFVDGGIVPSLTLKYYINNTNETSNLFIPDTPYIRHKLYFLIKGSTDLEYFLNKAILEYRKSELYEKLKK